VVLPILHLDGYKIAMASTLARIGTEDLTSLIQGYGWDPVVVEGHEPAVMHQQHQQMAGALDDATRRTGTSSSGPDRAVPSPVNTGR